MNGFIVALVVAVAVGLRLWRRRSRAGPRQRLRSGLGPFKSDVALVAAREIRERLRGRIFRVGTLVILAGVAAAIVIPTFDKSTPQTQQVGLVGTLAPPLRASVVSSAESVGTTVRFVPEPTQAGAHADLRSGDIDLAIIDGRDLLVNTPVDANDTSTTAAFVQEVSTNLGVTLALQAARLSARQASVLEHAGPLPVHSLQPGKAKGTTHTTSIIGLILIFVMLTQYNTWTLIGVMEEKSSRVIEVLLAAVRPIQLLTGKVLGIGLVAFGQATLIVGFALVLADAVGSDLLHGSAPLVVLSTLAWLVLGYAFYCWVYAAAGSMTERQGQVQSLAFPLSLPIILGYVVSITAASSGDASLFFKVLAYVPLTAPFAMPVLVGLGAATWWEFVASVLISIASTAAVARLATGIYRRAVLRTGRRVHLREVFG